MSFSVKFKALLSLTETKSIVLANHLSVDAAVISRMKTGARKMPRDKQFLQNVCRYIAGRLDTEYKRSELYEMTGDARLKSSYDIDSLTEIIYDWLTAVADVPFAQTGKFLRSINETKPLRPDTMTVAMLSEHNKVTPEEFAVYHNNEGKRKAAEAFFNYIMSLKKPETIRIFTDESDSWIIENPMYMQQLSDDIKLFTKRGFCVQRVQPPARNIEGTLRDIEMWLPAYTAGTLKMYYYPWARDELHRRTIMLLPGHIAVYSMSLYGQKQSHMTIVSTEAEIVDSFDKYFDDILERCRTMISVYTLDESDKIFNCIQKIARVSNSGLYKSFRLSAHTLPTDVILRTIQRGSNYVRQLMECYGQAERFKCEVLEKHVITDIICLPKLEDVMAGREPIPGTAAGNNTVYYTPSEYLHHLNRIIWYMKNYPNYRIALVDENELENVIIYTKGDDHALLIKKAFPFTVFEITDTVLSSAITGYLRRIADEKMCSGSRDDTLRKLRNEAARVETSIRQQTAVG